MLEELKNSIQDALAAVQEKYDGFTESVSKLNQDLSELRDMFVSVKNVVSSVFSFVGQETSILLLCTFLFLFVVNMIPFLFIGERLRYYAGVCFGIFLSIRFEYAAWSLIKYVLIMFSPVLLEYLLALFFRTAGKSLWIVTKKSMALFWRALKAFFRRLREKTKKENGNEK